MTLQFSKSNAMPGDPISLRVSTKAASLVLVSVHDKSLELLAKACTSIDANSVSYEEAVKNGEGYICMNCTPNNPIG